MENFKQPKIRDKSHIVRLRELPCLTCKRSPSEASHIRLKANAGMRQKPSDSRALPLCHSCHMRSHDGERTFWGDGLDDAIQLAEDLYKVTGNKDKAMWLMLGWMR